MAALKTIGLLGGMSWESSQIYYQQLNRLINQHLGGLHSAPIIMINVDFAPLEKLLVAGDWSALEAQLSAHCQTLEQAGADCLVLATNTMHQLADELEQAINIPLLHIADSVGQVLQQKNINKVGLLGTAFTMKGQFYRERLAQKFAIESVIPEEAEIISTNDIIFNELCHGKLLGASKAHYLTVVDQLASKGAQAVVLGCTEIGLLVQQADTDTPLIDATHTHIEAAATFALSGVS